MLNGRAFSLNFIVFKIKHSDLWHLIFGHGPGQLDVLISRYRPVHWAKYYPEPSNPHNDFLKILYEYGVAGFLVFGWNMSRLFSRNVLGTALLLFTLILFFFDNSLIHAYYNFIALVIFCSVDHPTNEENSDQP
jgi:O-antigen ligase